MPTGGGGGGGGVKGWPLTFFSTGLNPSDASAGSSNVVAISAFVLPYTLTFANMLVDVSVADAVNNYDFGIYNQAGTLVANIGPQTLPATGLKKLATTQGVQTINPGLYLFGFTCTVATAEIGMSFAVVLWHAFVNVGSSSGATLPTSIGAVSLAPVLGEQMCCGMC